MKTRILSMILVVVMLTLSLVGCAYNYDRDDVLKYVEIDVEAIKAALAEISVDDGSFGHDEAARQNKVVDAIKASLASKSEDKGKTTGAVGKNDVVYYCFYAKDAAGKIYSASSMVKSTADNCKIQLSLSSNEDLDAAIDAAIAGKEVKFDVRNSGDEVKAGDIVVVTYKKAVPDGTDDDGNKKTKEITYTNDIITLEAKTGENADSFAQHLVGRKVGTTYNADSDAYKLGEDTTYKEFTIKQAIESANVYTATYTYDEETKLEAVGEADKINVKGEPLTYYVFPVKYDAVLDYESSGYNASYILKTLIGTSMNAGTLEEKNKKGKVVVEAAKGTLPLFTDNSYSFDGVLMHDLAVALVEALTELDEAKTAVTDAESDLSTAEEAYGKNDSTANKEAVTKAKEKLEIKKSALSGAEATLEKAVNKLLSAKNAEGKTADAAVIEQYRQYRYDSLESSYKNEVKGNIAEALYDIAVKAITFKTDKDGNLKLPKKAVKDAYTRIRNAHEYDFYEGTISSDSSVTNYESYKGNIDAYLATTLSVEATKSAIKAELTKQAEEAVKQTLIVYAFKNACEQIFPDADFDVKKDDIKEFKNSINYLLLTYYSGKNDVDECYYVPALQFDKVMDYVVEIDEENVNADANDKTLKFVRIAKVTYHDHDHDHDHD